jgi:hypothetical protein
MDGVNQADLGLPDGDPDHNEENSQFAHPDPASWRISMRLAEAWLAEQPCGWWIEDYRLLRSQGWKWKDAFSVVWMSLRRDDRGALGSVEELTNWLGVTRRWFYGRRSKFDNQPVKGANLWDLMAEQLQLRRLKGARLAEVDERTFDAAVAQGGTARDRELYYKRAGVLPSTVQVTGSTSNEVKVNFDVSGLPAEVLADLADEGEPGGAAPGGSG